MKQEYLDSLIPKRSDFLENLRYKSSLEESYAPIVQKQTEQLIITLLKLIKPKRVLEVGTAVGYSAILMADNLPEDSSIITIERYKKHADIAVDNIFASGYEKKIRVIEGEAAEVLHWLDGGFDFIFEYRREQDAEYDLTVLFSKIEKSLMLFAENPDITVGEILNKIKVTQEERNGKPKCEQSKDLLKSLKTMWKLTKSRAKTVLSLISA